MKKILVTGAGGPAGVNFLRSLHLAKERMELYGTDINMYHKEFAKPFTNKMFIVPRADSKNYISFINDIIDERNISFVHPQPDVEVAAISEGRDKLAAPTFLPEKEVIRVLQDKHESASIWKKNGFPSVRSIEIRRDHLAVDIIRALDEFGGKMWIRAKKGAGGTGSTPVDNIDTAINWIMYWISRGKNWEFIAQEYLPGLNAAFQSIWKNGELITSQARERVEYIYPYLAPSGVTGTPIIARTIHNDQVNEMATKAILAIAPNATGIFCVDMKGDKHGNICPTEINAGRFFTTSYFFSIAGKKYDKPKGNMPYMLAKLAYKEKIPEGPIYNVVPKDLYWIRHIDCNSHLIEAKDL